MAIWAKTIGNVCKYYLLALIAILSQKRRHFLPIRFAKNLKKYLHRSQGAPHTKVLENRNFLAPPKLGWKQLMQGPILQNSISAGNVPDKYSSSKLGQSSIQQKHTYVLL
jgi:hypothetical protein